MSGSLFIQLKQDYLGMWTELTRLSLHGVSLQINYLNEAYLFVVNHYESQCVA